MCEAMTTPNASTMVAMTALNMMPTTDKTEPRIDPWDREIRYLKLSNSGQWISFVQIAYPYGDKDSQMMIIRNDGSEARELVSTHGKLDFPVWSKSDDTIYYVEDSRLYSVDVSSLDKRYYSTVSDISGLISLSPDGNWLVNGYRRSDGSSMWFINLNSGEIIMAENDAEYLIGWEK